jgi:hypothetical protein
VWCVQVENFRTPNFTLVAEVLYWMVQRYDPLMSVPEVIEEENDRVEFLTTICQVQLAGWVWVGVEVVGGWVWMECTARPHICPECPTRCQVWGGCRRW